ncbi:protein kinase [Acidithiobacillus sp. IBUN Pt1247-S3]|uniref:protein kinase n=1 Tax=Acidithiobacillus sp. IBUN Pt1247-S3 TaxID=3166642 RepID=UPI0034E52C83
MAPELVNGALGDSRSDVYAFGVTLYRLFSAAKSPIGPQGYRKLRKYRLDCPEWLDCVLAKMPAKIPIIAMPILSKSCMISINSRGWRHPKMTQKNVQDGPYKK